DVARSGAWMAPPTLRRMVAHFEALLGTSVRGKPEWFAVLCNLRPSRVAGCGHRRAGCRGARADSASPTWLMLPSEPARLLRHESHGRTAGAPGSIRQLASPFGQQHAPERDFCAA